MSAVGFRVQRPDIWQSGVVVASPHSGSHYPEGFLARARLDAHEIRTSEDAFVDQLYERAPALGMAFLTARLPRAYVDLNRSVQELDPAVIEGVVRRGQNPRVASGLGVIPRVVAQGRPIYNGKLSQAEAEARLDQVWYPYHDTLQSLLDESRRRFGETVLLDCHSMPHEALENMGGPGRRVPEIVLGDRFGAAADSRIVDHIEAAFAAEGFEVGRNSPFAGAYIAQTYGRPSRRQHAVQVEIDRSLYMDEQDIRPHAGFEGVQARLSRALAEIARIASDPLRLAAE